MLLQHCSFSRHAVCCEGFRITWITLHYFPQVCFVHCLLILFLKRDFDFESLSQVGKCDARKSMLCILQSGQAGRDTATLAPFKNGSCSMTQFLQTHTSCLWSLSGGAAAAVYSVADWHFLPSNAAHQRRVEEETNLRKVLQSSPSFRGILVLSLLRHY